MLSSSSGTCWWRVWRKATYRQDPLHLGTMDGWERRVWSEWAFFRPLGSTKEVRYNLLRLYMVVRKLTRLEVVRHPGPHHLETSKRALRLSTICVPTARKAPIMSFHARTSGRASGVCPQSGIPHSQGL